MYILWLIVFSGFNFVTADRILAIFPNPAVSHFYAFEPYLVELAHRGHDVVVVSQFPQKHKIQNYTDLDIQYERNATLHGLNIGENEHLKFFNIMEIMYVLLDVLEIEDALVLEKTINSLKNDMEFDLVIIELFNTDLFLGLANKFQVPVIAVSSGLFMPWGTDRFAIPDNPSYIPVLISTSSEGMTFQQRLTNSIMYLVFKTMYKYKYLQNSEKRARKVFGEGMLPLDELAKRTSLVLVNTHFSISVRRPLPPQVIEVAGIHIKPVKPLPQEIEKFIDESEYGVIYFSFGSLVLSSTMKEATLRAFCDVFSELPQRVIWKWEKAEMPGKPNNVKIVQWSPQRDILAHPNVRMFISHGGLLGTIEAIHSAVPILGIPFYGDQMQNVEKLAQLGVAVHLDYFNITKESLTYAVKALLGDKKYRKNVRQLAQIFKDRPMLPLDTAIYWTEYVLRHKGAHHLQTAAVHLSWYQYLLLDVIGSFILVGLALFYSLKVITRRFFVINKKCKKQ